MTWDWKKQELEKELAFDEHIVKRHEHLAKDREVWKKMGLIKDAKPDESRHHDAQEVLLFYTSFVIQNKYLKKQTHFMWEYHQLWVMMWTWVQR